MNLHRKGYTAMQTQSSPPPTESSTGSEVWKPPADTSRDRPDPSRCAWIAGLSRQVFSAYRRDEFADPEGFLVQLGMVLERYTDEVIREITSPLTGIQRKSKFPPSIAEIVEFCDDDVARRERIKRYNSMNTARYEPRAPKHSGNLLVLPGAPGYDLMVEMARRGDNPNLFRFDEHGVWVPLGLYEENKHVQVDTFKAYTEAQLLSLYGRDPKATRPTGAATRAKDEAEWSDFLEDR